MYTTLTLQYQLVTGARHALFAYCKTIKPEHLIKNIPEFNNSSMTSLLIHSANTYIHWLKKTGMQHPHDYFEDNKSGDMADIEKIFAEVDETVNDFLLLFEKVLDVPVVFNVPGKDKQLTLSPLELFTHTITHEFHHKGQMLTMSRMLGYIPADTDVIRS
jgi:uncharacterized damage-inducible protein DinB